MLLARFLQLPESLPWGTVVCKHVCAILDLTQAVQAVYLYFFTDDCCCFFFFFQRVVEEMLWFLKTEKMWVLEFLGSLISWSGFCHVSCNRETGYCRAATHACFPTTVKSRGGLYSPKEARLEKQPEYHSHRAPSTNILGQILAFEIVYLGCLKSTMLVTLSPMGAALGALFCVWEVALNALGTMCLPRQLFSVFPGNGL